jgi:hypothetical protein
LFLEVLKSLGGSNQLPFFGELGVLLGSQLISQTLQGFSLLALLKEFLLGRLLGLSSFGASFNSSLFGLLGGKSGSLSLCSLLLKSLLRLCCLGRCGNLGGLSSSGFFLCFLDLSRILLGFCSGSSSNISIFFSSCKLSRVLFSLCFS